MRLTRDTLLKVARDTAAQRARISRRIICIYLTGSVLTEDALLGGTTDIDLFIVHDSEPLQAREIVRLSDDVHLDITHFDQAIFHQPRHLRTDPWLGPFIYSKPLVLFDTQHWFDFMQAATGAQFYQPDYTLQRARVLAQAARQAWLDLNLNPPDGEGPRVKAYLKILEDAGNAIACLSGPPVPERRFFLQFPQKAQAINHPELSRQLVELIGGTTIQLDQDWNQWAQPWLDTLASVARQKESENIPARLHPARINYYSKAAAALWKDVPIASLWTMLNTWAEAISVLPPDAPEQSVWLTTCQNLHLDAEHFEDRLSAVDHYLDAMEETLDTWGRQNGVSEVV